MEINAEEDWLRTGVLFLEKMTHFTFAVHGKTRAINNFWKNSARGAMDELDDDGIMREQIQEIENELEALKVEREEIEEMEQVKQKLNKEGIKGISFKFCKTKKKLMK